MKTQQPAVKILSRSLSWEDKWPTRCKILIITIANVCWILRYYAMYSSYIISFNPWDTLGGGYTINLFYRLGDWDIYMVSDAAIVFAELIQLNLKSYLLSTNYEQKLCVLQSISIVIKCFHSDTSTCQVWEPRLEHCCPRKQQNVMEKQWALEASIKTWFCHLLWDQGQVPSLSLLCFTCNMRPMTPTLHRLLGGIKWYTQMSN